MSPGVLMIVIANAFSLVSPVFFLPSKLKRIGHLILFACVCAIYLLTEILLDLFVRGIIEWAVYYVTAVFLEVLCFFVIYSLFCKGNSWKNIFIATFYTGMIAVLFPSINQAMLDDVAGEPVDWWSGVSVFIFTILVCIFLDYVFYTFLPIKADYSNHTYRMIVIAFYGITIPASIVRQKAYYFDDEATGSIFSTNVAPVAIMGMGLIFACLVSVWLYNTLESKRLQRNTQKMRDEFFLRTDAQSEKTELRSSVGNLCLDVCLNQIHETYANNDVSYEFAANASFSEDYPLSDYELSKLLRACAEFSLSNCDKKSAWTITRIKWNRDMVLLYMEFNRGHQFRPLHNKRVLDFMYDLINSHFGTFFVKRRRNTYEINLLVLNNK